MMLAETDCRPQRTAFVSAGSELKGATCRTVRIVRANPAFAANGESLGVISAANLLIGRMVGWTMLRRVQPTVRQ